MHALEDEKEREREAWATRQIWGRLIIACVHDPKSAYEMLQGDKMPSAEGEDGEPADDDALTFRLLTRDPFFLPPLPAGLPL